MKYEAVFGNQDLFDGAGTFTGLNVVTISIASGNMMYCRLSDLTPKSLREYPVIAMRRIIQEPKLWTAEDQKAGRLPEVGCKIAGKRTGINTVLFNNGDYIVTISEGHCVGKYIVDEVFAYFSPLETPEEKAARLRSEWVELAFDNMMRKEGLHSTECLDRVKVHFGSAYDSLLSGALSAPTKGGE